MVLQFTLRYHCHGSGVAVHTAIPLLGAVVPQFTLQYHCHGSGAAVRFNYANEAGSGVAVHTAIPLQWQWCCSSHCDTTAVAEHWVAWITRNIVLHVFFICLLLESEQNLICYIACDHALSSASCHLASFTIWHVFCRRSYRADSWFQGTVWQKLVGHIQRLL